MKAELMPRTLSAIAGIDTLATIKGVGGSDSVIYPFFVSDEIRIRALSPTSLCEVHIPEKVFLSFDSEKEKFAVTRQFFRTVASMTSSSVEPVTLETRHLKESVKVRASTCDITVVEESTWKPEYDKVMAISIPINRELSVLENGKRFVFDILKMSEKATELTFSAKGRYLEVSCNAPTKVEVNHKFSVIFDGDKELGTFSASKLRRAVLGYLNKDADSIRLRLECGKPLVLQYIVGGISVAYMISPKVETPDKK